MTVQIKVFRCLTDNFGYLIHSPRTGATIAVDAPDAGAVARECLSAGWALTHVLVTHRHLDHIQGLPALKENFGVEIIAAHQAGDSVAPVDRRVGGGDRIDVGGIGFAVFDTPGHCDDHVSYYASDAEALFCGDVIFKLGCGRVLEGEAGVLFRSIDKLNELPDDTRIYGGHDYALGNARFAAAVEPDNPVVVAALAQAEADAKSGTLTSITTLRDERAMNPFLRTGVPAVQRAVKLEGAEPEAVFAALREWKNRF